MEHKIQKLDDDLINKIAAGEVIERPASVVKELVENSLDAGSTNIFVTIKDGGKKLIQVSDNGCGISASDLPLAVARHTTSKISNFDDIYHLKTMGFRGEALASICSIAKVNVASKVFDAEAVEIIVEDGGVLDQRACAQPQGTTISVRYLFYQTPARLKFLKTDETETSHVVDVVTKLALSHPDVGFRLIANERTLLDVPESQHPKERFVELVGRDLNDYLYEFQAQGAGMQMTGYLSHPQVAKSQRSYTYLFVNGRSVNDKVMWHAVTESYRDLLMKGRFPVMLLNLWVDENTVDVNVHPTKAEIRFHHGQQIHHFVHHTLRERLKAAPWLGSDSSNNSETIESLSPLMGEGRGEGGIQSSVQSWSDRYFSGEQKSGFRPASTMNSEARPTSWSEPQKQIQFGKTSYAEMTPIGQLLATYILCEAQGKLILVDQHAAHERVGFEKLMKEHREKGVKVQPLLIPETFDVRPSDADILKKYHEDFKEFGFEIEYFGGNTFVLKAMPLLLADKIDIRGFVMDLIEDLKATGELTSLKDKLHHIFATMACHAQIRAHHHLTLSEMQALLRELDEYQFTDFCPHGRPVSVEVTLPEIEKWFKRVL